MGYIGVFGFFNVLGRGLSFPDFDLMSKHQILYRVSFMIPYQQGYNFTVTFDSIFLLVGF